VPSVVMSAHGSRDDWRPSAVVSGTSIPNEPLGFVTVTWPCVTKKTDWLLRVHASGERSGAEPKKSHVPPSCAKTLVPPSLARDMSAS